MTVCILQEAFLRMQANAPTDDLELQNFQKAEYQELSSRLVFVKDSFYD